MTQQDHLENLAEVFAFLDGLRCTGSCNMFAASPFLAEVFDMKPDEARKAWSLWAKTFTLYTTPEERAATALAAERAHLRHDAGVESQNLAHENNSGPSALR